MSFAEKLKAERERLGLTQAQAAELIDVPGRTYWEWEAEKTTPYAITQEGALGRLRATKNDKRLASADGNLNHTEK